MGAGAVDGGNLRGDMIDAMTALDRLPGGFEVPDVAVRAFNLQTVQALVVVFGPEQYPDTDAVFEQAADEIGAHMAGRAGHEYGRRRRRGRSAGSWRHGPDLIRVCQPTKR